MSGSRTTRGSAPRELVPLDDARAIVLGLVEPLAAVVASIDRALGCRLARDVVAPFAQPRFDNSAMDGYAVRAAAVPAGGGAIARSAASPISTGMPIPEGADAVIPVERVRPLDELLEIEGARCPRGSRPAGGRGDRRRGRGAGGREPPDAWRPRLPLRVRVCRAAGRPAAPRRHPRHGRRGRRAGRTPWRRAGLRRRRAAPARPRPRGGRRGRRLRARPRRPPAHRSVAGPDGRGGRPRVQHRRRVGRHARPPGRRAGPRRLAAHPPGGHEARPADFDGHHRAGPGLHPAGQPAGRPARLRGARPARPPPARRPPGRPAAPDRGDDSRDDRASAGQPGARPGPAPARPAARGDRRRTAAPGDAVGCRGSRTASRSWRRSARRSSRGSRSPSKPGGQSRAGSSGAARAPDPVHGASRAPDPVHGAARARARFAARARESRASGPAVGAAQVTKGRGSRRARCTARSGGPDRAQTRPTMGPHATRVLRPATGPQ